MQRALDGLIGSWHGEGNGSYPDIAPFRYREETRITATAWPMLHVVQRTWRLGDDQPLHLETGLIIPQPDGSLLYACAQDAGRTEVMIARPVLADAGATIHLAWITTAHANDARLAKLGRDFWLTADTLVYKAYLSTVRTPEYRQHLEARLVRVA